MFLNKGINVLSLFDGMSCGRIALARSGIAVNTYHSSEIDKYAIIVSKANWNNNHLGDITNWREWVINWVSIDLPTDVIGARIVGRRLNDEGKREDNNKNIPIVQTVETRSDQKTNCMTTVSKDSMVVLRDKSKCLRVGGRNSPFGCKQEWDSPFIKVDKKLKIKNNQNKASCLTGGANSGGNHSDMDIMVIQKPRGFNKGGVKALNGKVPTLSSCSWEHNNHLSIDATIRRFTPVECERLQTVDDNYTKAVSNTQRYKMLGNGWTVDVIKHILDSSGLHHANT